MNRRSVALVGALALSVPLTPAAAATATAPAPSPTQARVAAPGATEDPGRALARLRAVAQAPLRVRREAGGRVSHLASTDGSAVLPAPSASDTPREAADAQLDRFGEAFGIDGTDSKAVVRRVVRSSTGGTVVRADQVVDGLPVLGGQVVLSLDDDNGVVAVDADTSGATTAPDPVVPETRARSSAVAAVAKLHRVDKGSLTAETVGRRLYDPAVAHTTDPAGARPVWQFEVSDGYQIRETVLIGTSRGETVLHFNDAPHLHRVVCDNANDDSLASDTADGVPTCDAPVRVEDDGPVPNLDVNAAYDNLGEVADTYDQLAAIDLTSVVGTTAGGGTTSLMATVRWCWSDLACPLQNAFWDGRQMVFGQGYVDADDVVGHELTHGYVERTADLFSFNQTGAVNESVADTIGEIVDQRNPSSPASDAAWNLGEDLPGGTLRNLADPTLFGQPDRMRSTLYQAPDYHDGDDGAVHQNNGVGNKTAYLISQGGTFNGQTVAGIDAGDPGLAKTGRLFVEVIPRLGQFAQWADLGLVLGSTCDQLEDAGTGGFTSDDCDNVRKAVTATELALEPLDGRSAPNAPVTCPARFWQPQLEATDDDATQDFATSFGTLWQRTPDNSTPTWARSGTSSWFAHDPNPFTYGDPSFSDAVLGPFTLPPGRGAVLSFQHAYLLEYLPAGGGFPAEYFDGAQVLVETSPDGSTGWTGVGSLPWVNGPDKTIEGSSVKGFAGDSHGYGTSSLNLSSLAGKHVRVTFRVLGDDSGSLIGWFVDNIALRSCASRVPGAPSLRSSSLSGTTVRVSWNPPAGVGSGVTSYQVIGAGKVLRTVSAATRTTTVTTPSTSRSVGFSVRAGNGFGEYGGTSGARTYAATASTTTAPARVKKRKPFVLTGRVRSAGRGVAGMPVVLQRKPAGARAWSNVATGTTSSAGTKAWSVRLLRSTRYRIVTRGSGGHFGSVSAARLVRKK